MEEGTIKWKEHGVFPLKPNLITLGNGNHYQSNVVETFAVTKPMRTHHVNPSSCALSEDHVKQSFVLFTITTNVTIKVFEKDLEIEIL